MVTVRFRDHSKFTYKDLLDLNDRDKSYASPLSLICHIDLNAFFAQCEQLRLGLAESDPVVCVQWNALIAVSYAARDYGITRMDRLEQAKLKCPHLIPAHTAVFKKGEPLWKYVDYVPSPINHKVSLDPYRREGKKVLNIFRENCDLVEKASVDESFMDLGRLIFAKIIELFPSLLDGMKDITDELPKLDSIPDSINYKGFIINKSDDLEPEPAIIDDSEEKSNINFLVEDWDDLVTLIGSMICFDLRKKVEKILGYKTSGGIGRVKTIAKLASGFKKPDQQTIIRNDAIPNFLKHFKLSDFWSFGGKTGNYISEQLGEMSISSISKNYKTPVELAKLLDNNIELANKIFKIVRGELYDPITEKEQIKTMGANKNFRGKSVCNTNDLLPWINVFIGELILRIQDIDEENNTTLRPVKLTLGATSATGVRHSKQCTISQPPKDYNQLRELFHTLSRDLLRNLEKLWGNSSMYPIINASLTSSTFVDLTSFNTLDDLMSTVQKRKLDPADVERNVPSSLPPLPIPKKKKYTIDTLLTEKKPSSDQSSTLNNSDENLPSEETSSDITNTKCPDCDEFIPSEDFQTHKDFHLAMALETKLNKEFEESYGEKLLKKGRSSAKTSKKFSKNQTKLPF